MGDFILHPQLAADTVFIGDLPLSSVLLMNDHRFSWLILVPRRERICELFELSSIDYHNYMREVRKVAEMLKVLTGADKMNIAALGNQVPQLHIHIIARFKTDIAWPQPVWNASRSPEPYPADQLAEMLERLQKLVTL